MPCNLDTQLTGAFFDRPRCPTPPWAERRLWDSGTANLAGVGRAGDFFPLVGRNRKAPLSLRPTAAADEGRPTGSDIVRSDAHQMGEEPFSKLECPANSF